MDFGDIENELVKLSRLSENDFDVLFDVASDDEIWAGHPAHDRYQLDGFTKYFQSLLDSDTPYLIIDKENGKVIGASCFYQYDDQRSSVAIGYSFLAKRYWGGFHNKSIKTLMLERAFTIVDTVLFHVRSENIRSQMALKKIGIKDFRIIEKTTGETSYEYAVHKSEFIK